MNYYYRTEDLKKNFWEYSNEEFQKECFHSSDIEHEFDELLKIEGSLFCINCMNNDGDSFDEGDKYYKVSEVKFKDEIEYQLEMEITCPFCGYTALDSWDKQEEDKECSCGDCHSIFSYTREVTVEYSSIPVKKNEDIKEI